VKMCSTPTRIDTRYQIAIEQDVAWGRRRPARTLVWVRKRLARTAPGCAGVPPARSPAPLHGDAGISPARSPGSAGVPPARSPAPLHGDAGISPARSPGSAGVPPASSPAPPHECAGISSARPPGCASVPPAWVRGRLARPPGCAGVLPARPHSPRAQASRPHAALRPITGAQASRPRPPCEDVTLRSTANSADREQTPLYGAYDYTRCAIRRARLAVMNVTRNAIPSVITTLIAAHLYERVSL